MKIGVLCSRIRAEERLLFAGLAARGIAFDILDERSLVFEIAPGRHAGAAVDNFAQYDVVLERCISHSRAHSILRILNDRGVQTINTAQVVDVCSDKLYTTSVLAAAGVPSPRVTVGYHGASVAVECAEIGYPVVMKPAVGSWGRLLSRVNDRDAAEALVDHKVQLGSDDHSVFYLQEYIDKPERDIRAFVVGGETICAIYRTSTHWITNTARGGESSNCPITVELDALCVAAANAVGGGIVAIDVLEDPDRGLLVNEVNHNMEFRNSLAPTGVDIPDRMVDFYLRVVEAGWASANGWS